MRVIDNIEFYTNMLQYFKYKQNWLNLFFNKDTNWIKKNKVNMQKCKWML